VIRLRVVGASEDADELILSNKTRGKKGSHALPIDQRLLDVLQDAVYAKRDRDRADRVQARMREVTLEPKIPPREIQRMLRAGLSPAEVAEEAGVDEAYVDQFITPVLYERREIVNDALSLVLEKPKLGPSGLPLGDAVEANLAARRVRMSDDSYADAWMATRQDGGPWLVTFTFPFRGRTQVARWRYDPRRKTLSAANRMAMDMGWTSPGRRPSVRAAAAKPAPSRKRTSTRKKPARKRTAARKPVRKPARRATSARKPVRKTTARKKPQTRRRPAVKRKPVKRKPVKRKPVHRKPAKRSTRRR
jgi:hypothetical protein